MVVDLAPVYGNKTANSLGLDIVVEKKRDFIVCPYFIFSPFLFRKLQ